MDTQRTPHDRTARRRVVAAAAVAVALLIAGTVLVTANGDEAPRAQASRAQAPVVPGPTPTPPRTPITPPPTQVTPPSTVPGDGSTTGRLLPVGTPSSHDASALVASVGIIHNGFFHLFADGRLIGVPNDVGDWEWEEQWLTPAGVERVRSEFLASPLFDPSRQPSEVASCTVFHTCVRDGDRLLSQEGGYWEPGRQTIATSESLQLLGYLRNLRSTLPSTEWVDDRSRLWVPSRIAVCLRMYRQGFETPVDLSVLLPLFPARAAELLGGREAIDDEVVRAGLAGVGISEGVTCFEMTLEEARTLSDELLAPSGPGTHAYWGILFRFDDQLAPLPADAKQAYLAAYVGFTELLPDGTPPRDPG